MREKKRIADEEREEAVAERIRTEETMAATIQASWKQGSDVNGKNYFYNYVTGESSWDPPKDWKSKVQDIWVRQVDQKLQVYYYNMKTSEVRWLPPCTICGKSAHKWCADCQVAYCDRDYKKLHEGEGVHPDMAGTCSRPSNSPPNTPFNSSSNILLCSLTLLPCRVYIYCVDTRKQSTCGRRRRWRRTS